MSFSTELGPRLARETDPGDEPLDSPVVDHRTTPHSGGDEPGQEDRKREDKPGLAAPGLEHGKEHEKGRYLSNDRRPLDQPDKPPLYPTRQPKRRWRRRLPQRQEKVRKPLF